MNLTQLTDGETVLRRYEYPDRWVVAADLGVDDELVSVDVVGETAIVVIDRDDVDAETEIDLPGAAAEATVNNGVLTIEVAK
jgi:HSP20 family molecular chaperone IbpA